MVTIMGMLPLIIGPDFVIKLETITESILSVIAAVTDPALTFRRPAFSAHTAKIDRCQDQWFSATLKMIFSPRRVIV